MESNDFFREMTLRLSSSLDLNVSLHRCLLWIREHIPVRRMLLALFEPSLGAIRFLADATVEKSEPIEEVLPLPAEIRGFVQHLLESGVPRTPPVQEGRSTPTGPLVEAFLGERGSQSWTMLLEVEGKKLAMLGLFSEGKDRLTGEHLGLLASLQAPFSLAVANGLLHRENCVLQQRLLEDNQFLRQQLLQLQGTGIIGEDSGLRRAMHLVRQVAPLSTPVLLLGETGVGKDVLAQTIHRLSPRRDGAFVKVNCGAMPDGLLESELFGHERGAFTGAVRRHKGYFERADQGTLFLDEIGELSMSAQVRLLDVLQSHEIEPIGGELRKKVDIRVIAATHRQLEEMVEAGTFRRDLWFRLHVFPIQLPALRERMEDIPLLLNHFVELHRKKLGFRHGPISLQHALERLMQHSWPGNVREFSNCIERALILGNGERLELDALMAEPSSRPMNTGFQEGSMATLAETNRVAIEEALRRSHGKIHGPGGAAERLDIHPNTLRSKMEKLGIVRGTKLSRGR